MKWIPIDKARKLQIDVPVFTKDAAGFFHHGKLIKEEKTKAGIERTFEIAQFHEGFAERPILASNITHVAIIE